jgi:hypothetical protein
MSSPHEQPDSLSVCDLADLLESQDPADRRTAAEKLARARFQKRVPGRLNPTQILEALFNSAQEKGGLA